MNKENIKEITLGEVGTDCAKLVIIDPIHLSCPKCDFVYTEEEKESMDKDIFVELKKPNSPLKREMDALDKKLENGVRIDTGGDGSWNVKVKVKDENIVILLDKK